QFAAAAPLTMNPILRCSSRLHSLDMFERDYFEHDTPDGIDPFERMAEAGFVGSGGGENIALGQSTPEEVMAAWMGSDGHCANIMRAEFDTIGVGFHPGAGGRGLGSNYWTQNFGAPPFMRSGGGRR
ncbi:MAG TPA: CAP domain-containing protein, partial [Polyangiaceae bacterium]|nr:CAP domain-containing protein [Polyangiaceae bacterium]